MSRTCIEEGRPATPQQRLQVMIDRLACKTLSEAEAIANIGEDAALLKALFHIGPDAIAAELRSLYPIGASTAEGPSSFASRTQMSCANGGVRRAVHKSNAYRGYPKFDRSTQTKTAIERIAAGLHEARAIARGDAKPALEGGAGHSFRANEAKLIMPAPPREPSAIALQAACKVMQSVTNTMLMAIDGQDIRDWTVGQCRSAGRRKAREARILAAISERLSHLTHTVCVGDIMHDDELRELIQSV